jgi:hypothetical protein
VGGNPIYSTKNLPFRHLVPILEQHVVIQHVAMSKCEENGDWLEFSPPQRLKGKLRACTRFSGIHINACCQTVLPAGHIPAKPENVVSYQATTTQDVS